MKRKPLFLFVSLLAAIVLYGQAFAQEESLGEISPVFSCVYECKPGPVVQGIPTWSEITTLMLVNQDANETRLANILFLDGNENILGRATNLDLSPEDLDEINVCRTLQAAGLPVPQAGLVEVYLQQQAPGGVYGWMKNLLGKFFVTVDEPFAGRVTSIAKTECRLAPPQVTTPGEIDQKFFASGAPDNVPLILIEGTADLDLTCQNNSDCASAEYCAKAWGNCDGQGTCQPRPEICTLEFIPVCGCDDQTYPNDCLAATAGVNVASSGACPP